MILLDLDILVHASNSASSQQQAAREWLGRQLTGSALVGMPWATLLGSLCSTDADLARFPGLNWRNPLA